MFTIFSLRLQWKKLLLQNDIPFKWNCCPQEKWTRTPSAQHFSMRRAQQTRNSRLLIRTPRSQSYWAFTWVQSMDTPRCQLQYRKHSLVMSWCQTPEDMSRGHAESCHSSHNSHNTGHNVSCCNVMGDQCVWDWVRLTYNWKTLIYPCGQAQNSQSVMKRGGYY